MNLPEFDRPASANIQIDERLKMMSFFRRIFGRAPVEPAEVRRARFIEEAAESLTEIPLPEDVDEPVRLVEIVPLASIHQARAVWAIKTRIGDQLMTVNRSNYLNEERWVVIVRARIFYAAWLAGRDQPTGLTGDPPDFQGLPSMPSWSDQPRAWSHGLQNPVPLAILGDGFLYQPDCHLAFVNGRNRLAWLIYHGAAAFPVEIGTEEAARMLHEMMGLPGFPPVSVAQLTD